MLDAGGRIYWAGIATAALTLLDARSILFAQSPITTAETPVADKVAWLANHSVTIRSIDPHDQDFADLRPLGQAIGNARIVLLGGAHDAAGVNAGDRLVRFLHQEMGFDVLAGQVNAFDAEAFDRASLAAATACH